MELRRKTRAGWEYFVIFFVVVSTLWLSMALYAKRDQVYKEHLLMNELMGMRAAMATYILEHRQKSPPSILATDPFGNSYHYNMQTGWISTTTRGYQNW